MDNPLLLPIAALQGLWVTQKRTHLPSPAGCAGRFDVDSGPTLRVVGVGDAGSDEAGVGDLWHAVTKSYAYQLQQRWRRNVEWRVHAVNGATAACTLHSLAPAVPPAHVYLVSTGASDALLGVEPSRFARNLHRIFTLLRRKSPESTIVFGDLPPLDGIAALPWPLRTVQARRARELHETAVAVASRHERTFCFRLPSRLPTLPRSVRPTTSATRGDRAARRSTRPRRPAASRRRG